MKRILLLLSAQLLAFIFLQAQSSVNGQFNLVAGTYNSTDSSDGIFVYRFNIKDGSYSLKSKTAGIKNPSYLTITGDGKKLYAVSEAGKGGGKIFAYDFDAGSGELKFINSASSGGDGPCYVEVSRDDKLVFAANYSGGSLSAIRVNEDGSLNQEVQAIQHEGSSINKDNQSRPHVHTTVLSPDNHYLLATDLGTDKVHVYRVDLNSSTPLATADEHVVDIVPGSGPRHLAFHPNGKYVYLVNELNGTVTSFDYKDGALTFKQTITMLTPDYKGTIEGADIHVSPDGKFLYASNREERNELLIYSIGKNGMLKYAGRQSTLGKAPRNFVIDPSGKYLLAANQNTNEIVIFERNKKTGLLHFTGKKIEMKKPVCLKFVAEP